MQTGQTICVIKGLGCLRGMPAGIGSPINATYGSGEPAHPDFKLWGFGWRRLLGYGLACASVKGPMSLLRVPWFRLNWGPPEYRFTTNVAQIMQFSAVIQ